MYPSTLPGPSWLREAWNRKTAILGVVLALLSLSLSHYAGFLQKVPLQLVAVAGLELAKGVTATFLFYVFFCAVVARVLTSIFQLMMLPFLAVTDRLELGFRRKMDWPHQRRFVRSHSQTIKWEGHVWIVFQLALFILLMLAIYVKFAVTWVSGIGLIISVLLAFLSGLVRAGFFLQPRARIFIRKIQTRRARHGRVAWAAFVTISAGLVVVAFFIGYMRASLLRDQQPQRIVTKEFNAMASVIASSDEAFLLFQKKGEDFRYIYATHAFTTSIETKEVFEPLRLKND